MRIDLRIVKKEPTTYKEDLTLDIPEVNGDVSAEVVLSKISGGFEASGNLSGEYSLVCSKCLRAFNKEFKIAFRFIMRKKPDSGKATLELNMDELDVISYEGDQVDLAEFISGEVLLNVPSKPLCVKDCKGICPVCGKNLNEGDCGCAEKEVSSAMSDMEKIKEKLYGGE